MENKNTISATHKNLENFIKLVKKATFLTEKELEIFNKIPQDVWLAIFEKNFAQNYEFSRRVLLNKFREIEKIDNYGLEKYKNKIYGMKKSLLFMNDAINKEIPILYITDFDNDGSLAQAIINEYMEIDKHGAKNMRVEYAQSIGGNNSRGLTLEHVELLVAGHNIDQEKEFLIVTADNGINSRQEQHRILAKFPNAKIIITDHHNPEPDMVVEENERTVIFNPHYKPTEFFKKYNISGANTIGVLLNRLLEDRLTPIELNSYSKNKEKITTLCKVSNLLDYVDSHPADKPEKEFLVTKFLKLQPLMNINNSISKMIVGEITPEIIESLKNKITNLNIEVLHEEVKNIQTQNQIARVLLKIFKNYHEGAYRTSTDEEENLEYFKNENVFNSIFLQEINNINNYLGSSANINPNHIEQLRPIIFGLNADYEKDVFLDNLANKMESVYESLKASEKIMASELRNGEVITKQKLKNSTFSYADPHVLKIFNRKFLNKVYNDENPGFTVTLDSIKPERTSGSFRSLYNISDILKDKKKLEIDLNITIETPGHEKAAGFIIKSKNPKKFPITADTLRKINEHINLAIEQIKEQEIKNQTEHILVDLNSIQIIDKINKTIRGNVSNFEKINCLLKLSKDTVWTDSYTTEQFTMQDIAKHKKYGYITVNTDFAGGTVIVPVELIKKIVASNYEDYLSLGYMDGGVFMVDRVLSTTDIKGIIDTSIISKKTASLIESFEQDFKNQSLVTMDREQIKDNPFFKYNDYGNLNFNLFEKMAIGIIDSNNVDYLTIFDVEANGFANAKIMNIGAMNYFINKATGVQVNSETFFNNHFCTLRGEEYLLSEIDKQGLRQITQEEKDNLPLNLKKHVLIKHSNLYNNENYTYFIHDKMVAQVEKNPNTKIEGFMIVKNFKEQTDGTVIYNREIAATMSAYLIKDGDLKVPQEMISLTGITQEVLEQYGKPSAFIDSDMFNYYSGKKVLFGAHNIPYDARILRANLPRMYETLRNNQVYDSAIFSKEEMLAYDATQVAYFENIEGLPKSIIFYNSEHSSFSLSKFLTRNINGYFPDRTNKYLLEIENGNYYLINKEEHEKVKLNVTDRELADNITIGSIPMKSVKYSVEKLSEQWMIHSLLLSDEGFDIKYVDLSHPDFKDLERYTEELKFFQDNYHFDVSAEKNILGFTSHFNEICLDRENGQLLLTKFTESFLALNKGIQEKFSDAWIYKAVLGVKEPKKGEIITNDFIDLVNFYTNIPKEKIRTIYDEVLQFKSKYNIDNVIHHEMHANGPWRTDEKGDVAFEDKLTLTLLAQREYNSYDHNIKNALMVFNDAKVRARTAFDIADGLSMGIAQDSYSFRQGIKYDRADLTPMIKNIQDKEARLSDETLTHIVKFQLDSDILPQDGFLYAIVKEGVSITREQIEEHKKKLGFVLINAQLATSLHNVFKQEDNKNIMDILSANKETIMQIKEELSKYYYHIEYNRKDYQIKQYIKKVKDLVEAGATITPKTKFPSLGEVDVEGLDLIKVVLKNYFNGLKSVYSSDSEYAQIKDIAIKAFDVLNKTIENHSATRLEHAAAFPTSGIKQTINENGEPNIFEENFLPNMSILKEKPLKILVEKNNEYNLLHNLVKQMVEQSKEYDMKKATRRTSQLN